MIGRVPYITNVTHPNRWRELDALTRDRNVSSIRIVVLLRLQPFLCTMSRVIAIAGGTSPTLGRSIVTAIAEIENKPIVLTRKSGGSTTSVPDGVEIRPVDYTDHASLLQALKDVHTVISVLKVPGPEWLTYQVNLLHAAKEAGVKRFAPSEFENGPLMDGKVDLLGLKPTVWKECLESGLECARFSGGMFMNYLAFGRDFGRDEKRKLDVLQGFEDVPAIWDVAGGVAEVPVKDDGTTPEITLTDIRDIGRFVAAACTLPDGKWESSMEMVGETINLDEVTRLIEEVTGKKLKHQPIDRDSLQRRADSIEGLGSNRDEMVTKMLSQINMATLEEQVGICILHPTVNELCPEVKPMSVRDYLVKCWS